MPASSAASSDLSIRSQQLSGTRVSSPPGISFPTAEDNEAVQARRPTYARIDLGAIAHNVTALRRHVFPAEVMAVVKAEGYGHGALPVARAALQAGATQLGVALLEEALTLRRQHIAVPILVFGGLFENQIEHYLAHDVQMTVYDLRLAQLISQRAQALGKAAHVHVKIDTGMGRVGVVEAPVAFVEKISALPGIELSGLYTHFATSDEAETAYAHLQLQRFRACVQELKAKGLEPRWVHAANSGAILGLPEARFNLVRAGVAMYGYYPGPEAQRTVPLQPAMSVHTRVLFVKQVPAQTFVSYGRTFQTHKATSLATLPIGYADGFRRSFSNNMSVLLRGRHFPVVGRVCMDEIMIDLGDQQIVQAGEEVVLLGRQADEEIAMAAWCEKLATIPYEVTCGISQRVPRFYEHDPS